MSGNLFILTLLFRLKILTASDKTSSDQSESDLAGEKARSPDFPISVAAPPAVLVQSGEFRTLRVLIVLHFLCVTS